MTIRFGWDISDVKSPIKQGSTGSINLTATVTKENGDPLDSYDGWTSRMQLYRTPQSDTPEIDKTPTVTGDAPNKKLIFAVTLEEADTKDLDIGEIIGDIRAADPDGKPYYPANITLTIERSYTKAA